MSQQKMVESLMKLLDDSEKIPEAAENYMKHNLIGKLLATLQYLETQIKELHAEVDNLQRNQQSKKEQSVDGPHGGYWSQFVGAVSGEEWERPSQGDVEVREAW